MDASSCSWIKGEAINLIESHIDLSAAFDELLLVEAGQRQDAIKQSDWKDVVQLAQAMDVSPSLLSTQQLAIKIVAGDMSGEAAVETAQLLQGHDMLEPRLFVSTLMKSLSKMPLDVTCHLLLSEHLSFWHIHSQSVS